jgi:large subunit ribosomal protein L24
MSESTPKRTKTKLRKNDQVVVITGAHKGKKGRVVRILTKEARVVVEGVNMVKKHVKRSAQGPGRIEEKEASLHLSNVALWNSSEKRAVKVGWKILDNGRKVRIDRKSGDVLDKE